MKNKTIGSDSRICKICGQELKRYEIETEKQKAISFICLDHFDYNPGEGLEKALKRQGYVIEKTKQGSLNEFFPL